ncbi:MAG: hypothetical protein F6K31_00430 [Symploca sp. SIO2G7]|nr:hypothetical protein [Symploca sp. SIO2G7]
MVGDRWQVVGIGDKLKSRAFCQLPYILEKQGNSSSGKRKAIAFYQR